MRIREIIRSVGKGKYVLYSHKGKRLSRPLSIAKVKQREKQVKKFKHLGKKGKK